MNGREKWKVCENFWHSGAVLGEDREWEGSECGLSNAREEELGEEVL